MTTTLKIFGVTAQGTFIVHKADCADCAKLEKQREHCAIEKHDNKLSVSRSIWADMINEGSMTPEDGLCEIHFAPCVKF